MALLLPWHDGFWEIYHSKLPPNWQNELKGDVHYFAPHLSTGELHLVDCPEYYYEYENEMAWVEESKTDPNEDPYKNWYPFQEFDDGNTNLNIYF